MSKNNTIKIIFVNIFRYFHSVYFIFVCGYYHYFTEQNEFVNKNMDLNLNNNNKTFHNTLYLDENQKNEGIIIQVNKEKKMVHSQ